jgi:uncharacterized protein
MTACIALGVAIDDLTHYMLRLRDVKKTMVATQIDPIKLTFHQCSHAMMATTRITGLGLAAFLLSLLAVMTRFAGLLIAILVISLLSEFVLLPTWLKVFHPSSVAAPKMQSERDAATGRG